MINNIAVKVGYEYIVVRKDELKHINLEDSGRKMIHKGEETPLYNGKTFEDSQSLDNVFDSGKYKVYRFF